MDFIGCMNNYFTIIDFGLLEVANIISDVVGHSRIRIPQTWIQIQIWYGEKSTPHVMVHNLSLEVDSCLMAIESFRGV